jgi:hypothetical protein
MSTRKSQLFARAPVARAHPGRRGGRRLALAAALLLTLPLSGLAQDSANADDADAAGSGSDAGSAAEATGRLGIELNRLEPLDGSCRVYLVFENQLGTSLQSLQLELVLFDDQGFVSRRLTLDAAPIAADKTSVKLFDLSETQCDAMGRILINDVLEMAGPDGPLPSDVDQLELSSKLDVDLFK